jgi:hypothetical protein
MKENKLLVKCLPVPKRLPYAAYLVILIARLIPVSSDAKYVKPVFHYHPLS